MIFLHVKWYDHSGTGLINNRSFLEQPFIYAKEYPMELIIPAIVDDGEHAENNLKENGCIILDL